jgi:hypothetical protein
LTVRTEIEVELAPREMPRPTDPDRCVPASEQTEGEATSAITQTESE